MSFLGPPDEASRHLTVSPEQWEVSSQFWAFSCDVLHRGHPCFGDIWDLPRDRALMMGCKRPWSCCVEKDPGWSCWSWPSHPVAEGDVSGSSGAWSHLSLPPVPELSFLSEIKDWGESCFATPTPVVQANSLKGKQPFCISMLNPAHQNWLIAQLN